MTKEYKKVDMQTAKLLSFLSCHIISYNLFMQGDITKEEFKILVNDFSPNFKDILKIILDNQQNVIALTDQLLKKAKEERKNIN